MDQDSNSRDSGDDFRSSAVISVAQRLACFATLIDELLVRIYSLMDEADPFAGSSCIPDGDLLAVWSNIVVEADQWWTDHALARLTQEQCRGLVAEMLGKGPVDGALLAIGICSRARLALASHSDVAVMQSWAATLVTKHRVIAQALALMVLAPWFAGAATSQDSLVRRVQDGALDDVNSTILVCLGLLQVAPDESSRLILDVLRSVARRSDIHAIDLLGGLIGRLWVLLPEAVEMWLCENCGRLSRRTFRFAVERVPAQKRSELTQQWKDRRLRPIERERF